MSKKMKAMLEELRNELNELRTRTGEERAELENRITVLENDLTKTREELSAAKEEVKAKNAQILVNEGMLNTKTCLLNTTVTDGTINAITVKKVTEIGGDKLAFDTYILEVNDNYPELGYKATIKSEVMECAEFVDNLYMSNEETKIDDKDAKTLIKNIKERNMDKAFDALRDIFGINEIVDDACNCGCHCNNEE